MNTKVTKTTSKGQITLPSEWRKQFETNNFLMEIKANQIVVKPVLIEEISSEELIFDADRDNNGKGIPVDEIISLLENELDG